MGAVNYLLDTHVLLFWLYKDERLSAACKAIVSDRDNTIVVSAASAWEIATKHRLGKLSVATELLADYGGWLRKAGFSELAITSAHARHAGMYPQNHRDPFDRVLAAQAELEALPLLTHDTALQEFPIETLW